MTKKELRKRILKIGIYIVIAFILGYFIYTFQEVMQHGQVPIKV